MNTQRQMIEAIDKAAHRAYSRGEQPAMYFALTELAGIPVSREEFFALEDELGRMRQASSSDTTRYDAAVKAAAVNAYRRVRFAA